MKKSFLLLLVLTLLPLAGWADNPQAVSETLTYDGSAKTVAVAGNTTGYRYRYAITNGTSKPAWSESSTNLPTATNAGTYRVYWAARNGGTVRETQEWNAQNNYFEVTIYKANNSVTSITIEGLQYGAGTPTPSITAANIDGVISYQYSANGTGGWGTYASVVKGNVGTWYVKATIGESANYQEVTSSPYSFKIDKAIVTITPGNETAKWRNPWLGIPMANITPTVTGATDWSHAQTYLQWKQVETIGDAGQGYLYTLEKNTNVDPNFEYVVSGDGTVNITKNTTGSIAGGGNGATQEYDGTPKTLAPANPCAYLDGQGNSAGTIEYKIIAPTAAATDWAEAVPTATNAGTYTVEVRGVGDVNHEDAAATITYDVLIDKGTPTVEITEVPGAPFVYPADEFDESKIVYTTNSDGSVDSYSFTKDGSAAAWDGSVGTWTVAITMAEGTNWYGATSLPFEFQVTPKALTESMLTKFNTPQDYDGTQITTGYELKDGAATLVNNTDFTYTITYAGNTINSSQVKNAGIYTYTFTGKGNYDSNTSFTATLTVNKVDYPATNIVDPVLRATWTYDGVEYALIETPASATGVIAADVAPASDFVYYLDDAETDIADIKVTNAKEAGYKVSYSINESQNYKAVIKKDLTPVIVEKAPLTITGATLNGVYTEPLITYTKEQLFICDDAYFAPVDKANGQAIAASLINIKLVDGTNEIVVGDDPVALEAGNYTVQLTENTAATVQNYKIKTLTPGVLAVAQADNEITTLTVADWTYGEAANDPVIAADFGVATVEYEYFDGTTSLGATAPTAAGENYSVKATIAETKNYKKAEKTATFKIDPKALAITIAPKTKTYGEDDPTFTATYDAFVTGETAETIGLTFTREKADTPEGENVDTYAITPVWDATKADKKANYDVTVTNGTLTITQKALKITIADKSKTYGEDDPTFTATYDAFVTGETAETIGLTFTREKADTPEGENVTTAGYAITPVWDATKADKKANYDVTVTNGTLTITQAENAIIDLAITGWEYGSYNAATNAPTANATFKGTDEPTFTYAKKGSTEFSDKVPTDAGEYTVKAYVAATANWAEAEDTKDFTITKAALTLTAKDKTKIYGEADPAFEASTTGLQFEEKLEDLGLTFSREKGENVGDYKITATLTKGDNYDFKDADATLSITPAPLIYTLANAEYDYTGEQLEPIEGEVFVLSNETKFVEGDSYGKEGTFYFTFDKAVIDAGPYNFAILKTNWNTEVHNYNVVFTKEAVVTINPAKVVVTAPIAATPTYTGEAQSLIATPATATFGEEAFEFLYSGNGQSSETYTEIKGTDAAEYEIAWKVNDNSGNFTFVDAEDKPAAEGTITAEIGVATIAVTAPEAAEGLVYTGAAQNVIATAATATFGEKEFKVQYSTEEEGTYTDELKLTDASTYTIYSKVVDESGNFAPAPIDPVEVSIEKATITVTAPVPATELEYKKEDLDLIATAAVASVAAETDKFEPVVLYSLEAEGEYSDALPKAQNANEAGYDVYYKVNGDDNHYDVAAASIKAVIAKREIMATAPSAEKTYDGTNVVEAGEFDEEIHYNGLLGGDKIDLGGKTPDQFVTVPADAINVGEYELTMSINDFPVQENYYVGTAVPGKLTIKQAAAVTIGFKENDPTYTKKYAEDYTFTLAAADLAVYSGTFFDDFAVLVPGDENDQLAIDYSLVGEDYGEYAIKPMLTTEATFQNNYEDVLFANGVFSITKAKVELRVSIADASSTYNGDVPTLAWAEDLSNMVVTGLPAGKDKAGIFTKLPEITVDATEGNVGEYNINLKGGESKNYEFKIMEGSYYTIEPVVVNAAFNSIPVAAVGVDAAELLAQVEFTVEAADEADAATLEANKNLFEVQYADPAIVDANGKIAEGADGNDALVIAYTGEYENFIFADGDVYADLNIGGEGAEIALNDAEEIVTYASSKGSNITFTQSRAVTDNVWQACVLPCKMSIEQFSDAFGYAAIDVFDPARTTADEIHFSLQVSGNIEAGVPFLFKTNNDNNFNKVTIEDVEVANTADLNPVVEDDDTDIKFIGTFETVNLTTSGYRYVSKGKWYNTVDGKEKPYVIKPLRAYLDLGTATEARIFVEEPDGTQTAIDAITFANVESGEGWYTVNGVKLNAAPTEKGTYIKDGKKVLVK